MFNSFLNQYSLLEKQSNIIYKITCGKCNKDLIGKTSRHLKVRLTEHEWSIGEIT